MEEISRKAINFDLDTNKMKTMSIYPNGYNKLEQSFKKLEFEHRQGSGYVSKNRLNSRKVVLIIREITRENPWLKDCVNKIDVTDIGKQFDLTKIVKKTKMQCNATENVSQECKDFILNLPNKSRRQKGKQSSNEAEL